MLDAVQRYESEVRSYCRSFPTVFDTAKGSKVWDKDGKEYLDFFDGAGALSYGHNHPQIKEKLIEYISRDGITHALDMATVAKDDLLETFWKLILEPRGLNYKVQFPGPTGTNSVEAALKLARKVTGRDKVMFFTNGFHGMTLGALSVTGNGFKREGAGIALSNGVCMPYGGYLGDDADTINYMDRFLADTSSGVDMPAAAIVETVQAEGGVNMASFGWLQKLEALCQEHGMLLIVDDIQVGCGRTGPFFSFEPAGITPDIVCLSKSIGAYGLPMALTLIKPELDQWAPGEHNGTFRGHNLAFVAATEALRLFWSDDKLQKETERKGRMVRKFLQEMKRKYPDLADDVRGRGLIQGLSWNNDDLAGEISMAAFKRGLLIETSGAKGEVAKVLPPLTVSDDELSKGFAILEEAAAEAVAGVRARRDEEDEESKSA
ncbi:MAG: diaminobutyrate--2-oxoglutarate transaminase [Chrysiogenetes bacterium]|nr:diaminobutyrate--2-oxoglutarate transaminase [Chrysiogenetes bacterium]